MTDTTHSPDVLRIAWVLRLVTEGIYERIYVSDEDVLTAFTLARDAYAGREAAINQIIKGEDLMLDDGEARSPTP